MKAEQITTGDGVKILGSGCAKCNVLEMTAKETLELLNMRDHMDF